MRHLQAVLIFRKILQSSSNEILTTVCWGELQGCDQPSVGDTIVELFLRMSPNVQETAQSILASRMVWSQQLLDAIDGGKIPAKRIKQDTIARLSWHRDSNLQT